jgi:molybdate transport system permease protein
MILQALALTLRLAVLVSAILMAIGLPFGYWLASSRWRGKFLVEAVVALPIVLPPTVLGFYVLAAIGPLSPIGRWYHSITGGSLAFTFRGLVVGSVLYSLPFAVQPIAAGFASVDRKLLQASATLGASDWRTFWRIVFPLGISGVLTGFVLSFAHTLGEFGVVLMIGGNIPGATQTVSILIYDQVQALNYAVANQTALLLLIVCFVLLTLLYALRRKGRWRLWGWQ